MLSLIILVWEDFVNDNPKNGDIMFLAEYAVKFYVGTKEGDSMKNCAQITFYVIGTCSANN